MGFCRRAAADGFGQLAFSMNQRPDPRRWWRSRSSLEFARAGALRHARAAWAERKSQAEKLKSEGANGYVQAMAAYHSGEEHLAFFRNHIEPQLRDLPPGFCAIEMAGDGVARRAHGHAGGGPGHRRRARLGNRLAV